MISWPDVHFGPINLWSTPNMSEQKKKVETFLATYTCDNCGEGSMIATGARFLSHPPKYPHVCDNCGAKDTFKCEYPRYVYE